MPKHNTQEANFLFPKRKATKDLVAELRQSGESVADYYRRKEAEGAVSEQGGGGVGPGKAGQRGQDDHGAGRLRGEGPETDRREIVVQPEATVEAGKEAGQLEDAAAVTYYCTGCSAPLFKGQKHCSACGAGPLDWRGVS